MDTQKNSSSKSNHSQNFNFYKTIDSKNKLNGREVILYSRSVYKYMILDSEKVCLHNVMNKQVGLTSLKKRAPYERVSVQATEYAQELADMFVDYAQNTGNSVDVWMDYKRSQPTVDTAIQSIKKFYPNNFSNSQGILENPSFFKAASDLQDMLKKVSQYPIDINYMLDHAIEFLTEPSASAGLPYALHPNHKKSQIVNNASFKEEFKMLINSMLDGDNLSYRSFTSPCIAYQKSAVIHKSDEEKVRLIWGYPLAMVLIEGLFAVPLIQSCKQAELEGEFPTAYQFGPFSDFHEKYVLQNFPVIVRDFSTYDSSVPEPVIRVVFELLWDTFKFKSKQDKAIFRLIYDCVIDYFIHTPILVAQTGTLFVKHHGIPSGSWFTSLIGSFCNYLMTVTVHVDLGYSFESMKCMGDDNIVQYKLLPSIYPLNQRLRDLFGLSINDDKCYAGPILGAKFLGRIFRFPANGKSGDLWWYRLPSTTYLQIMFPSGRETFDQMWIRLFSLYVDNPSWWFYCILKKVEHHIDQAFANQSVSDSKSYAEIELDRMLRMVTMVDYKYERLLKPPDLLRQLKKNSNARLF